MNTITTLSEKIAQAKDLDFGDIIDKMINLFKKVWLKGSLVVILITVFAIVLALVFQAIGLGSNTMFFNEGFVIDDFVKVYYVNLVYSLPQSMLVSTITIGLLAGFYRICEQELSGSTQNNDFFYFLSKEYFSKVFMLGILFTAIAFLAQALLFVPYIFAFIPLSYFSVVFANNPHLNEYDIVKASFAIGTKKWLISFGVMFVAGVLGCLGFIGCGIGVIFTISIVYLPAFLIYRESIGVVAHSEIDQIGETGY
ncbi:hypothetical protein [Aestuariibaculum suncheonense]|uniref:Glycerophosphoryl diester phosphodiesterase membrane domain-containing protein n=1 Tax=Aestuariibaculum suncheonense TaxID=1028745 RepID=A0A8J6QGF0_9FLAO|nr:hypothetical protein [Aestuariibaculum suncheonense]MBD0836120.1 hypothetical protein [Aestuariibaculum suncheonense]